MNIRASLQFAQADSWATVVVADQCSREQIAAAHGFGKRIEINGSIVRARERESVRISDEGVKPDLEPHCRQPGNFTQHHDLLVRAQVVRA